MSDIVYKDQKDTRMFKDTISGVIRKLCEEDPDVIYLDADLMSCIGTTGWAHDNPERGIDCGIAEANMIGIASGLAVAGFKPFVHSFGPFASRRCFDQAFLSAAYAGNHITILGSDPGVCAMYNGGTHMPFEDVALYRAVPNATVIDVTDTAMLESVFQQAKDMSGLVYIRSGRKDCYKVYADGCELPVGKAVCLREGADVTIVAAGIMVREALQAAQLLEEEGIEATVLDMFTIKPIDAETLLEHARRTGAVVTAENHNKIGGLYSAVCETLAETCPVPVEWIAVPDVFGEVGSQEFLMEKLGLTARDICEKAKKSIARKNNQ